MIDLDLGEAGDSLEDRRPDVTSEAHRDPGAEVDRHDGAHAQQEGHDEHQAAGPNDVVVVTLHDAVVDDVGVQVGQVQARNRLYEQEDHDDGDRLRVRPEVDLQERDHRTAAALVSIASPASAMAAAARIVRSASSRAASWSSVSDWSRWAKRARRSSPTRSAASRRGGVGSTSTTRRSLALCLRTTRPCFSIRSTMPVALATETSSS